MTCHERSTWSKRERVCWRELALAANAIHRFYRSIAPRHDDTQRRMKTMTQLLFPSVILVGLYNVVCAFAVAFQDTYRFLSLL